MAATDVLVNENPGGRFHTMTVVTPIAGEIDYVSIGRPDGSIVILPISDFTVVNGDTVSFTFRYQEE